jgi:hypothetical protein
MRGIGASMSARKDAALFFLEALNPFDARCVMLRRISTVVALLWVFVLDCGGPLPTDTGQDSGAVVDAGPVSPSCLGSCGPDNYCAAQDLCLPNDGSYFLCPDGYEACKVGTTCGAPGKNICTCPTTGCP